MSTSSQRHEWVKAKGTNISHFKFFHLRRWRKCSFLLSFWKFYRIYIYTQQQQSWVLFRYAWVVSFSHAFTFRDICESNLLSACEKCPRINTHVWHKGENFQVFKVSCCSWQLLPFFFIWLRHAQKWLRFLVDYKEKKSLVIFGFVEFLQHLPTPTRKGMSWHVLRSHISCLKDFANIHFKVFASAAIISSQCRAHFFL